MWVKKTDEIKLAKDKFWKLDERNMRLCCIFPSTFRCLKFSIIKNVKRRMMQSFLGVISFLCLLLNFHNIMLSSVQLLSCVQLCYPMDCSMPVFPVHHQLPELAQIHVQWISDAIQPSHLLSSPSPPAFNLSQHQGLFQWVSLSHQVAKVLELQLHHQSFQWIFKTDFL